MFVPYEVKYEAPPEAPKIAYTRSYAIELAERYGSMYGVNSGLIMAVMDCETGGDYGDPGIQSRHYQNGVREKSYGYSQINLPSWRGVVSYEEAVDPEFAVNFLAEKLSKGEGKLWTCYRYLNT